MKRKVILDGEYAIYENGMIMRIWKGAEIIPKISTTGDDGYFVVSVHGRPLYVHKLVAEAFIPNPENKPMVNHIDGNKRHNEVSNLEWVTRIENSFHAYTHGLSQYSDGAEREATPLKTARCLSGMTQVEVAAELNVSATTISNWERHDIAIPVDMAIKLAELFGYSISELKIRIVDRPFSGMNWEQKRIEMREFARKYGLEER